MTATAARSTHQDRYTTGAIVMHWLIAVLIFGLIGSGFAMMNLMQQGSELQYSVYQLHKSFGVMVLVLTVARVLWRIYNPPPAEPDTILPWERRVSHFVHMAFYSMMIFIPLSGWVLITVSPIQVETVLFFQNWLPWPHVPGLVTLSEAVQDTLYAASHNVHAVLAYGAGILAAMHIAGALKHQLADGDFIQRMLPAKRQRAERAATGRVTYGHATAWSTMLVFAVAMIGAGAVARMDNSVVADASAAIEPTIAAAPLAAEAVPAGNAPARWTRDPSVGALTFTMDFDGETITGTFANFDTNIVFDPDNLAASSVSVSIDTASAALSSRSVSEGQLFGRDGFAVSQYPEALFESDTIRAADTGYVADGTLTIRDQAIPQSLAFTVDITGDRAVAAGTLTLDRFAYGIGESSDGDGTTLAPTISVEFNIEADREDGAAAVAAAAPAGLSPVWQRDESVGSLTFLLDHSGEAITGTFAAFDTDIVFDPQDLAASRVEVTVDTGSAALSSGTINARQLTGPDGFAVADFPTARFVSETITADRDGYVAEGSLTIRGNAVPQRLAFTVEIDGDRAVASGEMAVDRFDFGIATDSDDSGTTLSPNILIAFQIEADRAPQDDTRLAGTAATQPQTTIPADASTAAVAAIAPSATPAPLWPVVADSSSLTFRFQFDGAEVVAVFEEFDADIRFDADNLAGSSINASIDLASAALQTAGVTDFQLKGPDGLNVSQSATATFVSSEIRAAGTGFEAVGTMALRGVEAPVTLPFELVVDGGIGQANGTVVVDRTVFGIATAADNVGEGVTVDVVIAAEAPASMVAAVK